MIYDWWGIKVQVFWFYIIEGYEPEVIFSRDKNKGQVSR